MDDLNFIQNVLAEMQYNIYTRLVTKKIDDHVYIQQLQRANFIYEMFLDEDCDKNDIVVHIINLCFAIGCLSMATILKLLKYDKSNIKNSSFWDKLDDLSSLLDIVSIREIKNQNELTKIKKKMSNGKHIQKYISDDSNVVIYLPDQKSVYVVKGYIRRDTLNIISRTDKYKSKINQLRKVLLSKDLKIPSTFRQNFIQELHFYDYIVFDNDELKSKMIKYHKKYESLSSMSISVIIKDFVKLPMNKQTEYITIMLMNGDNDMNNNAYLLYRLVTKNSFFVSNSNLSTDLFCSLSFNTQTKLKSIGELIKNTKKDISENETTNLPYDQRIYLSKMDKNIKKIALEKVEQLKPNNSEYHKIKSWLDGLLNIPFGKLHTDNINVLINDNVKSIYADILTINEKLSRNECKDCKIKFGDFTESLSSITKCVNVLKKSHVCEDENINTLKSKCIELHDETNVEIKKNIEYVSGVLDKSIYGHKRAKKKITQLMAQWMYNKDSKGSILGFKGPPGIRKTSLVKNGISNAFKDKDGNNRPFVFISMGGKTNSSYLVGHEYTYLGATWGAIVDGLIKCKCMNPIIYIDELDKVSKTEHGHEIIGVLTHLFDTTQNDQFQDKYFKGVDIDLSKSLIICSYNDDSIIDSILRDRIIQINLEGFTIVDKVDIVKKYLLPEISKEVGFVDKDIVISDLLTKYLVQNYTFESGVRDLKEKIYTILRDINLRRIMKDSFVIPHRITKADIDSSLNNDVVHFTKKFDKPYVGICIGMYATVAGIGGILPIQVIKNKRTEKLTITGHIKDIMKESITVANSVATNIIPKKYVNVKDSLHFHAPSGSTPKDGPSAGGAITTAIISCLTGIPIKDDVAMTGEIDVFGNIMRIGGLKAKILGAFNAGIKHIIVPKENEDDYNEIKKDLKKMMGIQVFYGLEGYDDDAKPDNGDIYITFVREIREILRIALCGFDGRFR
jgi:ATP-dependent Lon protease